MAERAPPLIVDVAMVADQLDVMAAIEAASAPDLGGLAIFIGTVRVSAAVEANSEKSVTSLDYDAHPTLALDRLEEVVRRAGARWDVRRAVAHHRVGHCEVGEPTVVIACGAPHRADALEACRFIIDALKAEVPIWKREGYADGSSWVGAEETS